MSLKINGFDLPGHISYSALDTYIGCGQRYYLTRVEKVPEEPAWWFVGGNAVHTATERIDKEFMDAEGGWIQDRSNTNFFSDAFDKHIAETLELSGVATELWRAGGRASKAWPLKENYDWWIQNGPEMVESWIKWRQGSGWQIVDFSGQLSIELEIDLPLDDFLLRMIIDRVVVNSDGEVAVLDLKSGSRSPSSDLQLAVYAAGMERIIGVRPKYGMYWMAREGSTTALTDLDYLPTDRVLSMIGKFDQARKSQIFLPNLKECHYCGVAQHCEWSKK